MPASEASCADGSYWEICERRCNFLCSVLRSSCPRVHTGASDAGQRAGQAALLALQLVGGVAGACKPFCKKKTDPCDLHLEWLRRLQRMLLPATTSKPATMPGVLCSKDATLGHPVQLARLRRLHRMHASSVVPSRACVQLIL